jgi:hypothetical protein
MDWRVAPDSPSGCNGGCVGVDACQPAKKGKYEKEKCLIQVLLLVGPLAIDGDFRTVVARNVITIRGELRVSVFLWFCSK